MTERRIVLGLALGIAIALLPALSRQPVAGATPSLSLVGAATYDVRPADGRVVVSVRLTAANHLKDTVTKRYFFRTGFLTVLPGTSGFKLTGGAGAPRGSISSEKPTYTILKLDLGANLAAGKSTTLTLTFDLKDPGGAPDRPVRISPSLVSFPAWAFATPNTPGASVQVRLPSGYHLTAGRGRLQGPTSDENGHDVWRSGSIADPLHYITDVAADRPSEYAETTRTVRLGPSTATVVLRAWPDDPAWRDRIGRLIDRALPVLQ